MLIGFSKFNFPTHMSIDSGSIKKLYLNEDFKIIFIEYGNREDDCLSSSVFVSLDAARASLSIMKIFINQAKAGLINYSTEHLNLLKEHMGVDDD